MSYIAFEMFTPCGGALQTSDQPDESSSNSSRRRTPADSLASSRANSPPSELSHQKCTTSAVGSSNNDSSSSDSSSSVSDVAPRETSDLEHVASGRVGNVLRNSRGRGRPPRAAAGRACRPPNAQKNTTRARAVALRAVRQQQAKEHRNASDFPVMTNAREAAQYSANLEQLHQLTVNSYTERDFDSSRFNDPVMAAAFAVNYQSKEAEGLEEAVEVTKDVDQRLLQTEQVR